MLSLVRQCRARASRWRRSEERWQVGRLLDISASRQAAVSAHAGLPRDYAAHSLCRCASSAPVAKQAMPSSMSERAGQPPPREMFLEVFRRRRLTPGSAGMVKIAFDFD